MDGPKANNLLVSCLTLEKETAGALVLAKREEVLEHLLHLLKSNEVHRKYWYNITVIVRQNQVVRSRPLTLACHVLCRAVTVGVPVPSQGVIDIPIMEREISGSRPHYKV